MPQIAFYFDQTRCTGCSACRVACKDWHDIPPGPENWMRIHYFEQGIFPHVHVSYLAAPCWHCEAPVCIPACPVQAIHKRKEDGIVLVNRQTCIGNEQCDEKCRKACPYKAPQFGSSPGAKMGKCDYCLDRFEKGKTPNCVEACPVRALDAGSLSELKRKYGDVTTAEGFKYARHVKPAVVFRPKLFEPPLEGC